MTETVNLSGEIEKQLPAELVEFVQEAGLVAAGQGQSFYLVGGAVRDLLLGRSNLDLDLVVEGDAITLAPRLAEIIGGKIITHPRFRTATLRWNSWSIDLITARSETYARPGALPKVKPGYLADDLFRRDFTINTMAVDLDPDRWGRLVDLYGGRDDLEHKLIRVLHEKSFTDDATRIWRALRYEQRLDFRLEGNTLRLLRRDIPMLDTISGDRIRHELERVLEEEFPEKVIDRAEELKVLAKLHPSLSGGGWLTEKFGQARKASSPAPPPVSLYLALLAYHLFKDETEDLISRLRLSKPLAEILRHTNSLKGKLEELADPKLPPSRVYALVHGYSPMAITAVSVAAYSPVARQPIQLFQDKLRHIKPSLTGTDLQKLGVPPGPRMKELLRRLHAARLDGEVESKKGEVELVEEWVKKDKEQ